MTPFGERLARAIRADGPMRLDWWMALVNARYYAARAGIGGGGGGEGEGEDEGDFLTAPEMSQAFGEVLGVWQVLAWRDMGSPSPVALVELGPGRGTLMRDLLRAARAVAPEFVAAAQVYFVETSPLLRADQARAVPAARFLERLERLDDALPALVVGNEFLDALPARQFVAAADGGWRERRVALGRDGGFAMAHCAAPDVAPPAPFVGAVVERAAAAEAVVAFLAERVARVPTRALFLDYARDDPWSDTLAAVRAHRPADPLADPGANDLSVRVDMARLAALARARGARARVASQAAALTALGFHARCERLAARAPDAATRDAVRRAARRIADPADPDGMGTLFQTLDIAAPCAEPPPWAQAPGARASA